MRRARRVWNSLSMTLAMLCLLWLALGGAFRNGRALAQDPVVYRGLDVLFLVDQSGSMGGRHTGSGAHPIPNDPEGLRFFAPQHFVTLLGADRLQAHPEATFRVAAVQFGDTAVEGMDWQVIAPESWKEWDGQEKEFEEIHLAAGEYETRNLGNTNFLEAFETAHRMFERLPAGQPEPRHKLMIVLTDGQPCIPPPPSPVTETVSSEAESAQIPPCLPWWEHMRDLEEYSAEHFPEPEYTIYAVAMNDSNSDYYKHVEPYWVRITNDRTGKVVENTGDIARRFREILLEMVADLPPKTDVVDTFVTPGPVDVEPYLESIEFTFYKQVKEERLFVSDHTGTVLRPDMLNVAVAGEDRIVETVTVYQPEPGTWQVETTSKSREVEIAKRQVRARGVLRSPTGSQLQYTPVLIEWRLEDSRGAALPDYADPHYRLQAEATISAGGQSWPLQLLGTGNSTYAATFTPVVETAHTISMKAVSQDVNNIPVVVFEGEVGTFSVGPVVIAPRNVPVAAPQFSPLTMEYELRDTGGRPVGIQSPVLISATLSTADHQWPLILQAGADGVFRGEFTPLEHGVHSIDLVATLQAPSGETRILSEQQGGGSFDVVQPVVTLRSPVGTQAQFLPMTVAFEAMDGLANPLVTAPGYQLKLQGTMRAQGHEEAFALLPTSSATYSAVFTPTVAGVYELEATALVVDLAGAEHQFFRSKTPVNVVATTRLDFRVVEPRGLQQEVRTFLFKPVPLVLEVHLEREGGQPADPAQVLLTKRDAPFTVKVYDEQKQDRSVDLSLRPSGIPGVYRAESEAFGTGKYEVALEAVAEPQVGFIWGRSTLAIVVERIENRVIRLAQFIGPALLALAVAGVLLRRSHLKRVTAHPCRGVLYMQDAYGMTLWTRTLGGRNRLVFAKKDLHPSSHLKRMEVICKTDDESTRKKVYITAISDRGAPVIKNELFQPGSRRKLGAQEVYLVKDPGAGADW